MTATACQYARMRPQPPLLAGASSSFVRLLSWESGRRRYLSHIPGAEHPLVAQIPPWDLFICAKDLFVEAKHPRHGGRAIAPDLFTKRP